MAGAATELTDANFAEMTGKGVAVVDFWAEWCPPCRMQGPIIEKIAGEYAGRAVVGKLDTDSSRETAAGFGIQSIPTIIVLKDGKEHKRMIGLQTEARLKEVLDEVLGEAPSA
jgi:thioredoxin 1